ncbi:MAG TPA: hypothetical protein VFM68_02660 [Candidatus Saccharimonadales bacterium]|nr:hypothetical protein [Candidatus Saccharimonadales bacterium]
MRERPIVQDLNKMYDDGVVRFSLDDSDEVTQLKNQKRTITVERPGRVEGRPRKHQATVSVLAETAVYQSLAELHHDKPTKPTNNYQKWTIEDVPVDVVAKYQEWINDADNYSVEKLQDAAHQLAAQPVDRLTATMPCPDCSRSTMGIGGPYACRRSGYAKEIYKYPLIRVQDDTTNEIHEVPMDVALYIDTQESGVAYQIDTDIDYHGILSAKRTLALTGNSLSAEYVQQATNGAVQPKSTSLTILPDVVRMQDTGIVINSWKEKEDSLSLRLQTIHTEHLNPKEHIEAMQDKLAIAQTERVTDIDYNKMFTVVRRKLGERGLALAFQYVYEGMGESAAKFDAMKDSKQLHGEGSYDIDAYEALAELYDKVETT